VKVIYTDEALADLDGILIFHRIDVAIPEVISQPVSPIQQRRGRAS
jgi:hypothetical protein